MIALLPGEGTDLKRETAGAYYVVIEGSGATEAGGNRFEWGYSDIVVVPNFTWHRHINTGTLDAVICSVFDGAAQHRTVLRAGTREGGKVTELIA